MICELCGEEHNGNYGSGRFCSQKCARSFGTKSKRQEINQRVSEKLKGHPSPIKGQTYEEYYGEEKGKLLREKRGKNQKLPNHQIIVPYLTKERNRQIGVQKREATKVVQRLNRIVNYPWSDLSPGEQRERVWNEQGKVCDKCKIDSWMGQELIFEYHHKNGDKYNNSRENVQYICPNCHSQTLTDRFKNRHHSRESVIKILRAMLQNGTFKQIVDPKYKEIFL